MLTKEIKALRELRDTVEIGCNPPDDCNDPKVLKTYMKGCLEAARKCFKLQHKKGLLH
jgi:hypothetical protein